MSAPSAPPRRARAAARGLLLAALAGVALAACDELTSELQPDPASVPMHDIIAASTDAPDGIPADGASTARVAARIPRKASPKTVTFTTTAGTFVESGAKTVTVRAADDPGDVATAVASTLLRADTSAGAAIVRAAVGEYYDTVSVRFVKRP